MNRGIARGIINESTLKRHYPVIMSEAKNLVSY